MAYNNNKGPQHSGDIQFEGDPNDVQIDFENDQVSLKAGGVNRLTAASGSVSVSGSLTASADIKATGDIHATAYYGDGSNLQGIAGAASGSARLYSTTGLETSGFLKVSGSSTLNSVAATTISASGGVVAVGSITSSADIVASGSVFVAQGQFIGLPNRADLMQLNDGNVKVNGAVFVTDGLSGSNIMHNVGNATFGGTVASTGSVTAAGVFSTTLSASSVSQLVGSISSSGDLAVSGNVHATAYYGDGSNLSGVGSGAAASGSARVYSTTGLETSGFLKVSGSSVMEDITANGITNVGAYSGSSTIRNVGSISSSADLAVTGNVHATAFYGDGSNLSGVGGGAAASGSARVYSTTGLETSGFLKVSGSSTLNDVSGTLAQFTTLTASQIVGGSPISISASSITFSGSVEFSGSSTISASSATLTSLTASAISGGSPIEIIGDRVTLIGDGGINMIGPVSSSNVIRTANSISASIDLAVSGAVHAATFHGDGSGLINVSAGAPTSLSGTTAQLTTGVETSGFLKVSGSSDFATTITASNGINIGNNNASASFGPKALEIYWNGTNGVMESEVGHLNIRVNQSAKDIRLRMGDAAGSSKVEFRTNADANVATVDSTGLISGSGGLQIVGSTILGNNLNVSGTTSMEGLTANGITNVANYSGSGIITSVGSISSSADVAVSGNIHATAFYGDGSNLSGVGGGGSVSGSSRVYSSTGLETSGFLKVSGSTTMAGTLRTAGHTDITHHAFRSTGTSAFFIPFTTDAESSSPTFKHQMIAPLPGRLLKVFLRTQNAQGGNVTVKLFKAQDTVEDFNAGGDEVEAVTVSMPVKNTSYAFVLSGSSPQYAAGNIIGVEVNPLASGGDYNVTCIWEYNDTDL